MLRESQKYIRKLDAYNLSADIDSLMSIVMNMTSSLAAPSHRNVGIGIEFCVWS